LNIHYTIFVIIIEWYWVWHFRKYPGITETGLLLEYKQLKNYFYKWFFFFFITGTLCLYLQIHVILHSECIRVHIRITVKRDKIILNIVLKNIIAIIIHTISIMGRSSYIILCALNDIFICRCFIQIHPTSSFI
jgi:hypothetical protein